jgi:hypothetical protein
MAALRKFTEGSQAAATGLPRAVERFREAAAIDSTFASAWWALTAYMGNLGHPRASTDSVWERAFRHQDRLSDDQRVNFLASYYSGGPGRDRAKAIALWEETVVEKSLSIATISRSH